MGITIKIPGATFAKFVDREVPSISLATGYWLFGTDSASSFTNLAPNAPAATPTVTGTPVYGNGFVQLNPDNWFNSGITPTATADYTYIVVSDFARTGAICGTWHSGISPHMIHSFGAGVSHATAGGSSYATTNNRAAGAIHFAAVTRKSSGRATYLADAVNGLVKTTAPDYVGGATNTFACAPGGFGNTADKTNTKYAACMLFPTALTDTQVADIYGYMKWKLAKRGVAVV